jgi:RNA polymerase sigma-70 factor (ECF subfamily)
MGFLGSRAEADDAAQDAMLHLSRKLHLWDGERPYVPWRNALVANLCRDRLRAAERRRRHEREAARDQPEAVDDPDPGEWAALDLQARLERVLGWLSPREREVFVLIDLEGHSSLEAGEQLGIAASTVRAALTLARRKLRGWMQPLQSEAEA